MMTIDRAKLYPDFAALLNRLVGLLPRHGLKMRGTEGYRTLARQAELYAQGRTAPGPKVTNAPAGESPHNWGCAVDFCFVEGDPYSGHECDWRVFGALAEGVGLRWGGFFTNTDKPHVEYRQWREVKAKGWRP